MNWEGVISKGSMKKMGLLDIISIFMTMSHHIVARGLSLGPPAFCSLEKKKIVFLFFSSCIGKKFSLVDVSYGTDCSF